MNQNYPFLVKMELSKVFSYKSRLPRGKTMDNKLMYIPNDEMMIAKQKHTPCVDQYHKWIVIAIVYQPIQIRKRYQKF